MADSPQPDWVEEVGRYDPERRLAALFAPAERRLGLLALLAFNLEVAKTAEVVSEPLIGRIRLQWWRESLDGIEGGAARRHAVVEALAEAIRRYALPRAPLDSLIEARELDLDPEPPPDLPALLRYAEATGGGLTGLGLRLLAAPEPPPEAALEAARQVGTAWALVGLLRAVPFHARQKRLYLPADLVASAGLELGGLFELRPSPALSRVTEALAEAAEQRLAAARRLRPAVPRPLRAALLSAVLADGHLKRLRRAGQDPFDARVAAPLPGAAWRLALASLRGRY